MRYINWLALKLQTTNIWYVFAAVIIGLSYWSNSKKESSVLAKTKSCEEKGGKAVKTGKYEMMCIKKDSEIPLE